MRTTLERFDAKWIPEPNSGCWLWLASCDKDGYGKFGIGGRTTRANRASWQMRRGGIPDGQQVLHRCDTPCCVNPEHLFIGDDKVNAADKAAKGRASRVSVPRPGEANPAARLSATQVARMRRLRADGAQLKQLAEQYGVSLSHVSNVVRGLRWRTA